MAQEARLVLTIAVVVCVLITVIALEFVVTGDSALARGVGQYGRHGSS